MPTQRSHKGAGKKQSARKKASKSRKGPGPKRGSHVNQGNSNRGKSALNNAGRMRSNHISQSSRGDTTVLKGRETIATIYTSVAKQVTILKLMPTNSSIFPRLSGIARNYQKYRLVKLRWEYHTQCPATQTGVFAACIQADAQADSNSIPTSLQQFEDMVAGDCRSVCYGCSGMVSFDKEFPWYDLATPGNAELSSWCALVLATEGANTTGVLCGFVTLEFELEVKFSQISGPLTYMDTLAGTEILNSSLLPFNYRRDGAHHYFYFYPKEFNPLIIGSFSTTTARPTNVAAPTTVTGTTMVDLPADYDWNVSGYTDLAPLYGGGYVLEGTLVSNRATAFDLGTISTKEMYVSVQDINDGAWDTYQLTTSGSGGAIYEGGWGTTGGRSIRSITFNWHLSGAQLWSSPCRLRFMLSFDSSNNQDFWNVADSAVTTLANELTFSLRRYQDTVPIGSTPTDPPVLDAARWPLMHETKTFMDPQGRLVNVPSGISPLRVAEPDVRSLNEWDDVKSDSGRSIPPMGDRRFRDGDPRKLYRTDADLLRNNTPR